MGGAALCAFDVKVFRGQQWYTLGGSHIIPMANIPRGTTIKPWMIITLSLALLVFLLAAFASGPSAVIFMLERSAVTTTGAGAAVAPVDTTTLTDAQLDRLALEVRGQYLDHRAESINWWLMAAAISLAAITVFVTALGILIVIAGFIGYRWFRDILDDARRYTAEAQKSAAEAQIIAAQAQTTATKAEQLSEDAEQTVERIREAEQEAQQARDAIRGSTAEDAATSQELQRLADQMTNLIEVGDLDRATAEAIRLQTDGNNTAAIQKWQAIANLAGGNDNQRAALAWFSVGYLHGQAEEYELAISAYDKSIELNPQSSVPYNNRGVDKVRLQRFDQAISDYDTAIEIDGQNATAYYNRGNAKALQQQYAAAVADYDAAIRMNPEYSEAYNNRAEVEIERGNYDDAISDCNKAIQFSPELAEPYFHRGRARLALGDEVNSRADLTRAWELADQQEDDELKRKVEEALAKMAGRE